MNALYFSTGQAARELGATQAQVRALCQTSAIAAELTDGGQYRIPREMVEKLKRDGLPSAPRPLPGDNPRPAPAKARYGHPALLAEPSEIVVAGAEEVAITENLLKKRKLEQQLEETEDWFRERERKEADQQAADDEEERLRLAAEEAQRERVGWLRRWETFALDAVPYDVAPELRLQVYEAVRLRLGDLDPIPPEDITRKLVSFEVQRFVAHNRREQEIEQILLDCRDRLLPYEARGSWGELSHWQIRAVKVAAVAIGQFRKDAPVEEIRAVATQAVQQVVAEFLHEKACREMAEWVFLPGTSAEDELGRQAVREALARLPVGAPRKQMEVEKEAALQPIRAAIAERKAQELAQQQRDQDQAMRQAVLNGVAWKLPFDLGVEQKQAALAAVAKAVNALPEFTPNDALERSRDQALQPFLDAHTQRKRKAQLIEDGLRGIFPYILKLEVDWDFEGKTAWTLEPEVREPIRQQLEKELTGAETPEQVQTRAQRLVREKLGIERRLVHVQKAS